MELNVDHGCLHEDGFFNPQYCLRTNIHPNLGVVFSDFIIPYIKEAEEAAIHFHSMLRDIQSVG